MLGGKPWVEEMKPDPLDVVDFEIKEPLVEKPTPKAVEKPKPEAVTTPQPEAVSESQPEVKTPVVDDPNVRRAPNVELIPPLPPADNGELVEDFKQFDLPSKEQQITTTINGRDVD